MNKRYVTTAVRALKGAPVSIILALSAAPEGEAYQVQQLAVMTGYSEQGVDMGLRVLETLGLVHSHAPHCGWMLTNAMRPLRFQ
jgi:DNA-binding IscR family transcriptional regulator